MVEKYVFGSPFETEAVTEKITAKTDVTTIVCGEITVENGFCYQYQMEEADVIYGLGEANRGINKRGYQYEIGRAHV